ncbi:MAG: iron-containing alcohol dehydrogenase [Solirubrobacteraceae bacterium]
MTEVVLGEDAVARLAARAAAEGWAGALVVMDANTLAAAGVSVVEALRGAGVAVDEFVFAERSGLLAGPDEAGAVAARLGGASWLPVAVGSGVITDIVRYAAHGAGRDFVSVPTAASMDGYASGVAAMQVEGVKVTYPARAPVAIYADPRVAAAAPAELTRAGLGDLLAKATAGVDWLAAHLLYGEAYDAGAVELVSDPLRFASLSADRVMAGEPAAVAELLEGLIGSGTAMARAGSSRPASGCEHHASHFWDLLAAHGRRPHESHGLQVGYATRFAMRLQRFAFGGGVATLRAPAWPADPLGPEARAWLGDPVAPEIADAVAAKQRFVAHHLADDRHHLGDDRHILGDDRHMLGDDRHIRGQPGPGWPASQGEWEEVRRRIAPAMARFDDVEVALDVAGIPRGPGWLGLDADTLRATFRYATRLRARYTVLDFLEGQSVLQEAVEAALAQT